MTLAVQAGTPITTTIEAKPPVSVEAHWREQPLSHGSHPDSTLSTFCGAGMSETAAQSRPASRWTARFFWHTMKGSIMKLVAIGGRAHRDQARTPHAGGAADREGFSVRPTLTYRGRTFKGLRGWSGKPLHPPLTDFPIVAYVLAAAFDVISIIGGDDNSWACEFWHAGTYVFVAGAAVSVLTALTGVWDRGSSPTPARRRAARSTATPRS